MKTEISLTETERATLVAFATFKEKHERVPSPAELAKLMKYADRSGVQRALGRLEAAGLIRSPQPRDLTPKGRRFLSGETEG
jgi:DNA-binding MarR family transcriptional regulator